MVHLVELPICITSIWGVALCWSTPSPLCLGLPRVLISLISLHQFRLPIQTLKFLQQYPTISAWRDVRRSYVHSTGSADTDDFAVDRVPAIFFTGLDPSKKCVWPRQPSSSNLIISSAAHLSIHFTGPECQTLVVSGLRSIRYNLAMRPSIFTVSHRRRKSSTGSRAPRAEAIGRQPGP
jgi:hypothetical protein